MEEDWDETKITYGLIFKGTSEEIIRFKEQLPNILEGVEVIYQRKSLVPLYITTRPQKTD